MDQLVMFIHVCVCVFVRYVKYGTALEHKDTYLYAKCFESVQQLCFMTSMSYSDLKLSPYINL